MPVRFLPFTSWQPGGARGATLPATFPAATIVARYRDAAGAVHRGLFDVVTTDIAQPDELPWSSIIEWTPADAT